MKKLVVFLVLSVMLASAFVAASHTQEIVDWWRLRDYVAPADISALADASGLNEKGRKLFYVHEPALLDKTEFQGSCTVSEATIVLGCYISRQNIYLYNVSDERLAGVEEVTAAHEMLHAAYDRLELAERERVDKLLQEAYERVDSERLRNNIAAYRERDPSIVNNELHSILGTEVRNLPRDLEDYYRRYFDDRAKVVSLAEAYSAEFVRREEQIASYDQQLSVLNGEISRRQADLNTQVAALEQERILVEQLRGNPQAFNQAVDAYNAKVTMYNNGVAEVKRLVEQYNNIVEERNQIAVEERDLVNAIDTRVTEL